MEEYLTISGGSPTESRGWIESAERMEGVRSLLKLSELNKSMENMKC